MIQNNPNNSETSTNIPDNSALGKQPKKKKISVLKHIIIFILVFIFGLALIITYVLNYASSETGKTLDDVKQEMNSYIHLQKRRIIFKNKYLIQSELDKIPSLPGCEAKAEMMRIILNSNFIYASPETGYDTLCDEQLRKAAGMDKPNMSAEDYEDASCAMLMQLGYRYGECKKRAQYKRQCLDMNDVDVDKECSNY